MLIASESELSSDQGGHTAPYCQPKHDPHPTLEQLRDKTYFARLQVTLITKPLHHKIMYFATFINTKHII